MTPRVSVEDLARQLLITQDTQRVLGILDIQYPNINSKKGVLHRLKALLIEKNPRAADYESCMNARIDELKMLKGAEARLLTLYDFRGLPLKRQLQVQKKISIDPDSSLCDPEDRQFYITLPLLPDWIRNVRLSSNDAKKVCEEQHARLMQASTDVVRIENADSMITRCRRILRDEEFDPVETAVALAVCTGRRMVEIFLKGHFVEHVAHKYSVIFHGQAKCGLTNIHSMSEDFSRPYPIPTLATGSSVLRAVSRLRGHLGDAPRTPSDINKQWCKKLNVYVKTNIHPHLTFHDLRTLYALLSFEAFKPHSYGLNGWVCKTLGHTSVNMSVHYTRMQVFGVSRFSRHKLNAAEDFTHAQGTF